MTFSLTRCEDKKRWDEFVTSSPQGSVFCTVAFLDALGEDYELLLVEDNKQPRLGAVVLKQDAKPIRAPYPFTMYQGVLFDNSSRTMPHHKRLKWALEVTEFLLSEMERRYDRISFCLHHSVEDLRSFQWFHYHDPQPWQFKMELRYTALLDLRAIKDFGTYVSTIRTSRRQDYQHALSEGLTVEESSDIDTLNWLHGLTFKRQGIQQSLEEERLLLAISEAAISKGFGRVLLCREKQGVAVSATLFLHDARDAYYLFGANHPDYRKTGSGTYLLLENIRWCMSRGLTWVDFCGINSPNRGDFKTSFNAAARPYFVVTWAKPT